MILYDDVEYAKQKLIHTVVRVDNEPVMVMDMGGGHVLIQYLKDGTEKTVLYSTLDITPVPLGYMNTPTKTVFICRRPMRQDWRQGLRSQNLVDLTGRSVEWDNVSLHNTIVGRYPTLEQAIDYFQENKDTRNPFAVQKTKDKTAFSREFALRSNGNIEYKGLFNVGKIRNGRPVLEDEFLWLSETLEQVA